jgi:hypothetical protein
MWQSENEMAIEGTFEVAQFWADPPLQLGSRGTNF